MRSKIVTKAITDLLTSPSRVAHSLDWRRASGSILSLRITKNVIELAVASHPSFQEPTMPLPSIPIERTEERIINERVSNELANVMKQHKVCGIVVAWPVKEEGWCGAQCGRVLNVLDQLVTQQTTSTASAGKVFHDSRPVCLYDSNHYEPTDDEWGRTPIYSRTPSPEKTVHVASLEQYQDTDGQAVLNVWNDFCAKHWPEFLNQPQRSSSLLQAKKTNTILQQQTMKPMFVKREMEATAF